MGQWCAHCAHNDLDEDPCDIQTAAIVHQTDDPEYPTEWIYRGGTPICTAFRHKADADGSEPAFRCDKTPDMLRGAG